jgi:uncharacterized membrane protein YfcA
MIIQLLLLGFVTGFLSGLLGIGGGVVMIPALIMVARLSIREAMGISLLAIIPTALVGFLKSYSAGFVDIRTSLIIASTAVIGAYFGSTVMGMLSTKSLRTIFGVFLIVIGLNILFDWTGSLAKQEGVGASLSEEGGAGKM